MDLIYERLVSKKQHPIKEWLIERVPILRDRKDRAMLTELKVRRDLILEDLKKGSYYVINEDTLNIQTYNKLKNNLRWGLYDFFQRVDTIHKLNSQEWLIERRTRINTNKKLRMMGELTG